MGTCGDLGGGTLKALGITGTGQKQHLDHTDLGSRLGSAVHWVVLPGASDGSFWALISSFYIKKIKGYPM